MTLDDLAMSLIHDVLADGQPSASHAHVVEALEDTEADGFHRGVRAAIAALYYQAGHLDAVADDLRRRDKCGYAATCERKASRLVMAAMSLEHVRSVAYQEGVA